MDCLQTLRPTYTAKELLDLALPSLPKTKSGLIRLADRENWAFTYRQDRGGSFKKYLAHLLPDYVKEAIVSQGKIDRFEMIAATGRKKQPVEIGNLTAGQKEKALAIADLVRLYVNHIEKAPWGEKHTAKDTFMTLYSMREWPHLHAALGECSLQTVERWKKTIETTGDAFSLADKRGVHKKGKSSLTAEQGIILLRLALNPNNNRISYVVKWAEKIMERRGINYHSKATYTRHLTEYRSKNYDLWVMAREGKGAYEAKAGYDLKRDFSKIQVGDVAVADGHTLDFEVINPFTGKPKRMTLILFYDMKSNYPLGWEIMPTENTAAIHAALRRAILALGKYPECAYLDNGRAFKGRFFTNSPNFDEAGFTGLYARLGIETTFAWPYHGQSKTIERFFGDVAELESMMPTYVGNCTAAKPPRMKRGEKMHIALWQKATKGLVLTMEQAHQAVAFFFEEYVNREQGPDSHIAGQRPIDLFMAGKGPGVNREELIELMMDSSIKTIGQEGVRIHNEYYWHPQLYGRIDQVRVSFDLVDRSYVLIHELDGKFLCEARPKTAVHAMAKLGTDADRETLKEQIELKRSLEAKTVSSFREILNNEVYPDYVRQLEAQGIVPIGDAPSLRKPEKKTRERTKAEILRIETEYQQRLLEQAEWKKENEAEQEEAYVPTVMNAAAMLWEEIDSLDGDQRYEKLVELNVKGTMIPRKWQAWMDFFEQTPAYEKQIDYWEEYRAKMAMVWQVESAMR